MGGHFASTLVSFPFNKLMKIGAVFKKGFLNQNELATEEIIEKIIDLSYVSKKQGLLALESAVEEIDNKFLKKGILLIVDGTDPELVREILEMEITNLEERHKVGQDIILCMGKFAPAFGMIGTLIGLIKMLGNLDDAATLGPSMAVALVTTFYGALLANVVFSPLAAKLKGKTSKEAQEMEILVEGMISIQAGESPYIIEEKLKTYIFLQA